MDLNPGSHWPGEGSLAVDGISIPLKEAKPLPSSD
jgi:hypothetical protein